MYVFIQKSVVMKQILTVITLLAMALSFASCEREIIVNCNCQCCNSDNSGQTGNRPGNNDDNNGSNNGGTNNDGNGGSNNDGGSGSDDTDRSEYQTYNNTLTQGQAGYYGVYYEDQPSNTSNWYIELADNNYNLETYEGEGYNIVFELFASGTNSTKIPEGKYSVEAFDKNPYSAGSLMEGFITEDEEYGEYPAGTWFFDGNEGIAGATAGEVTISVSGSTYTIKYNLYDDEYGVAFSGSFNGALTIYDGTQEYSYVQTLPATKSTSSSAKHFRLRR